MTGAWMRIELPPPPPPPPTSNTSTGVDVMSETDHYALLVRVRFQIIRNARA
eukprot:COSAG05_NODE_579_length_8556_cov_44.773679_6_plen_52_part_00